MTELSERLKQEMRDGKSIRALDGLKLDTSIVDKFAAYLHLPVDEVYRMAGILPPMYTDGKINRTWLLSKLWDVLTRLPEEDQALVLSEAIKLSKKYPPPDEQTET